MDIVLFEPSVAYPKEVPEGGPRSPSFAGRDQWAQQGEDGMPAGTVWRSEHSAPTQLVRLAASLIRDFPRHAPSLLRRIAPGRVLRLARYVERERPDILFINLPPAELATFFARRLAMSRAFPPIVPIMRNVAILGIGHTKRRRLFFPEAAHVVAVSRGVAESLSTSVGVPAERITPIYNPVFTPDIARRAAATPDHPWFRDSGPPVILGVGRLTSQKDFVTLIEAFRRVSAERSCRLIILGEGPRRPQLEEQVRALGIEDCVSLPGRTENPYAFMSNAALFVLSSRYEGFPGVLVEALACGCSAASTDCPAGPSEILEDSGLLAPVGDPGALSRIMLRVLDRPVDRAALRALAARFSMQRAVDRYENVIARIIARQYGNQ